MTDTIQKKYKKKKNGKNETGRPTVFSKETILALYNAFTVSATDEEACLMADISMSSLYNYQKENPDFLDKKKRLKKSLSLKSRQVIARKIAEENNVDVAEWWLEHKEKNEFSKRQELTGADGEAIIPTIEITPVTVIGK